MREALFLKYDVQSLWLIDDGDFFENSTVISKMAMDGCLENIYVHLEKSNCMREALFLKYEVQSLWLIDDGGFFQKFNSYF